MPATNDRDVKTLSWTSVNIIYRGIIYVCQQWASIVNYCRHACRVYIQKYTVKNLYISIKRCVAQIHICRSHLFNTGQHIDSRMKRHLLFFRKALWRTLHIFDEYFPRILQSYICSMNQNSWWALSMNPFKLYMLDEPQTSLQRVPRIALVLCPCARAWRIIRQSIRSPESCDE